MAAEKLGKQFIFTNLSRRGLGGPCVREGGTLREGNSRPASPSCRIPTHLQQAQAEYEVAKQVWAKRSELPLSQVRFTSRRSRSRDASDSEWARAGNRGMWRARPVELGLVTVAVGIREALSSAFIILTCDLHGSDVCTAHACKLVETLRVGLVGNALLGKIK